MKAKRKERPAKEMSASLPSAPPESSDCFVIVDMTGRLWGGDGWVAPGEMDSALLFNREPDPFSEACAARDFLAAGGVKCMLVYFAFNPVRKSTPDMSSGVQSDGMAPTKRIAKTGSP